MSRSLKLILLLCAALALPAAAAVPRKKAKAKPVAASRLQDKAPQPFGEQADRKSVV